MLLVLTPTTSLQRTTDTTMIVIFVLILFLAFSYLRPLLLEIERRDALLLNATLSSNKSQFLSEEWLLGNAMEGESLKAAAARVEPDWSLALGTFSHTKDENFEEFLISAGLSFFTRSIILNTSPSVTFDRVFHGDDYYYDLPDNDHPDVKYEEAEGGGVIRDSEGRAEEGRAFQMVLTTSSWVTLTQRFRLGRPFIKQDYDGTPSKNTYVFVAPTVLFHYKEKQHVNTTILHTFDQAGLVTTIISGATGMQARRHFRREGADA